MQRVSSEHELYQTGGGCEREHDVSGGPSRWRDVVTSFHKHHLPAFRGSCQGLPDCQATWKVRPTGNPGLQG